MNINRKPENSKKFCCPKGLEENELFLPRDLSLSIFKYETLKSPFLKS